LNGTGDQPTVASIATILNTIANQSQGALLQKELESNRSKPVSGSTGKTGNRQHRQGQHRSVALEPVASAPVATSSPSGQ
jgi:hypothetical protein